MVLTGVSWKGERRRVLAGAGAGVSKKGVDRGRDRGFEEGCWRNKR